MCVRFVIFTRFVSTIICFVVPDNIQRTKEVIDTLRALHI